MLMKNVLLILFTTLTVGGLILMLSCTKEKPTSAGPGSQKDYTGTISGYVSSQLTGMPLKGVTVFINADSAVPAISSADGSFEIGKVSEGAHRIHFSHMDYEDDSTVTVTLSMGENKKLADTVRLSYAYYILKGKVLSTTGGTVVGAGVVCANTGKSSISDDAGNYIIDRLSKTGDNFKLICAKNDLGFNVVSPIRGVADDTTFIPDIALNKTGGTVTGTVYDSLGNPVAGAVVQSVAGGLRDTTGVDGAYRIDNVPIDEKDISIYVSVNGKSAAVTGLLVSSRAFLTGVDLRLRQPSAAGHGMTITVNDVIVKDTATIVTVYAFAATDSVTRIISYEWFLSGHSTPDTVTTGNVMTFLISKLIGAATGSDVQVRVRAMNQRGEYSPDQGFYIKIRSIHPVVFAKVSVSPDSAGRDSVVIGLNQAAFFTGRAMVSFGGIDTMEWDFGDGSVKWTTSDTVAVLGHTYDTAGNFKAIFRVKDAAGNVVRDTVDVTVQKPSIPAPLYGLPVNGDTVRTMGDSVRLVWYEVSGVNMKYNVYLTSQNTIPGLGDKVVSLSTDTSATIPIVKGKRYYWKVEAVSSTAKAMGVVWNFVIISGQVNRAPVFSTTTAQMLDSATECRPRTPSMEGH